MGAWIEIFLRTDNVPVSKSLPLWERGLKLPLNHYNHSESPVAPLVGAWIEIVYAQIEWAIDIVAPLVGAWIEISNIISIKNDYSVAPLVGAWIEIGLTEHMQANKEVAPLVGAWIEIVCTKETTSTNKVAPLVGAWIEISNEPTDPFAVFGRSPCGSVD